MKKNRYPPKISQSPAGIAIMIVNIILLASCTNPLKDTLNLVVRDYSRPSTVVTPGNGEGIDKNTAIIITFSETMDTGTLSLGGTMPAESDGGIWSSHGGEKDSLLTISPLSDW